jgi:hypothetical protein
VDVAADVARRSVVNERELKAMRDDQFGPPGPSTGAVTGIFLVPIGLVVIFAGLCLSGWLISVVHGMLYHPEQVPLVSKVIELVQKDDVVFQMVEENGVKRYEGAGVRYGILLLLLIIAIGAVGSVIKACLTGGAAIMNAGLGRKPEEPGKK